MCTLPSTASWRWPAVRKRTEGPLGGTERSAQRYGAASTTHAALHALDGRYGLVPEGLSRFLSSCPPPAAESGRIAPTVQQPTELQPARFAPPPPHQRYDPNLCYAGGVPTSVCPSTRCASPSVLSSRGIELERSGNHRTAYERQARPTTTPTPGHPLLCNGQTHMRKGQNMGGQGHGTQSQHSRSFQRPLPAFKAPQSQQPPPRQQPLPPPPPPTGTYRSPPGPHGMQSPCSYTAPIHDGTVPPIDATVVMPGIHALVDDCAGGVLVWQVAPAAFDGWNTGVSQRKSLVFNPTGQLLATTSHDRKLHLFDPHAGSNAVCVGEGHRCIKSARGVWMGDRDRIATTGFSRMSDRQVGVWETGVLKNLKTITLSGRDAPERAMGSWKYRCFEYESNTLHALDEHKSSDMQHGMRFVPRHVVSTLECEIARTYKLTTSAIEPIVFIVPHKSDSFQSNIFLPSPLIEPELTTGEFFSGKPIVLKYISLDTGAVSTAAPTTSASYFPPPMRTQTMLFTLKAWA
ncbi:hypothetical protein BC826DRAFT_1117201 [Russula brevipes]|nr:hypothetical protein BC826DRAFT_1117201 [Russula brevipes]